MKKISTVNMDPKKKFKLIGNILGVFGNENIRGHHIKYFEDKVMEHKENTIKDITLAPNYYAWLCLITEHIFWLMRSFCFKKTELEHNNLTLLYNETITKFCDTCRNLELFSVHELKTLYETAVKVLEIRHAIIHKGFPNLLPAIFEEKHVRKKPAFTEKDRREKFCELTTREVIAWYSNPSHFDDI